MARKKKLPQERLMFRCSQADAEALRKAIDVKHLALDESDYIRDAMRRKLKEDGLL